MTVICPNTSCLLLLFLFLLLSSVITVAVILVVVTVAVVMLMLYSTVIVVSTVTIASLTLSFLLPFFLLCGCVYDCLCCVEITEVTPDKIMTESMDKQAAAERDRRKKVLEAEGNTSYRTHPLEHMLL